jgi:small subunit ribosomal protein S6
VNPRGVSAGGCRPCVAISTPAAARHATRPTFRQRTRRLAMPVKPKGAAVRPAFAIVARRMPGYYDLMLLVDPTAPEERRNAAISEAESMINSGGELVGSYDWGTRRMAYEIDHRPEADYRLYQFNGDNALLDRLNQRLRILDGVLRFRIIKLKPGQPTPPPPDQQAPRRRDEREAQDTKVAARAAADAPAPGEGEDVAASDEGQDVAAPGIDAQDTPTQDVAAPDAPPQDVAAPDAPAQDGPAQDAPTQDAPQAESSDPVAAPSSEDE